MREIGARDRSRDRRVARIAVIGSGFAGSLLARVLARRGASVLLVEKGRHPRFALGESTTPLGNLALERIARAHSIPDLWSLASYGRWRRDLPNLSMGLKRGFSFYHHRSGDSFGEGEDGERRLLVAASPNDDVADTQWLRADVDRFLVERAVEDGVEYVDETEVVAIEEGADQLSVCLSGLQQRSVDFVVDATGPRGVLHRLWALPDATERVPFRSSLLFGHFSGLVPFEEVADFAREPRPFPEHWSASHHLLEEGWMYQLPFDSGVTSAGVLLRESLSEPQDRSARREQEPETLFRRILSRYPSLERQFDAVEVVRSVDLRPAVQFRSGVSVGRRWCLLPHSYAFFDPLFSTGIAWSLVAIERLTSLVSEDGSLLASADLAALLERYRLLLDEEADHLSELLGVAYGALSEPGPFRRVALSYFACASYCETVQRMLDEPAGGWCWNGFLGATDAGLRSVVLELARSAGSRGESDHSGWLRSLQERDVAGLSASARHYGVDVEQVVASAHRLGLSRDAARTRLPRLFSPDRYPDDVHPR